MRDPSGFPGPGRKSVKSKKGEKSMKGEKGEIDGEAKY